MKPGYQVYNRQIPLHPECPNNEYEDITPLSQAAGYLSSKIYFLFWGLELAFLGINVNYLHT